MYNSDGSKQKPKSLPASAFGSVAQPAVRVVHQTSNEVIIDAHESGSIFFAIATASVGTTIAGDAGAIWTASENAGFNPGSVTEIFVTTGSFGTEQIRLPIQANCWSGSGVVGNTGDVMFIYKGGL